MNTEATNTTTNAGGEDSPRELDLMGWDAVYATTFSKVNEWLAGSGKLPQSFQGSSDGSDSGPATASGQWGGWQLVSGAPSNLLRAQATVASGSLQTEAGTFDLAGSTWTVQFGLTFSQDGSQAGGATTLSLAPATSGDAAPLVVGFTAPGVTGDAIYALQDIMGKVLPAEVQGLGAAFMSVTLNNQALAPDQPWLVPTAAGFACELLPGDARGGVFAILAMTEGRSAASNQWAVDRRVFDAAPEGTNAALVVGPSLVMEQLLTPAMQGLVQGSGASDFANDGTTVYNVSDMTWGTFTYDEGDGKTSNIQPRIPKGNIELSLDGGIVHLSMANINFPYPGWKGPGEITIAFDTEQFITFDFVLRPDGGLVMAPQTGKFNTSLHVTVTPDAVVIEFQIALNVTLQILMAVIGGVVQSATEAVTEAATDSITPASGGAFEADMTDLDGLVGSNASPDEISIIEEDAAEQGGDAVTNGDDPGYVQKFKNAVIANKWKIGMKVLNKLVTYPAGKTTEIAVRMAEKNYDELPTLNLFADAGIKPVNWADGSSFKIAGGGLCGALVLWGTINA